jgi:putative peptidoglycan lipid II flippase
LDRDKHGPVGRPADFFDQDAEPVDANASWGPDRAGRGVLYDQDSRRGTGQRDALAEARRQRLLERQRDRERDLQREADLEGAGQIRWTRNGDKGEQPARPEQRYGPGPPDRPGPPDKPGPPDRPGPPNRRVDPVGEPLRISSRPGETTDRGSLTRPRPLSRMGAPAGVPLSTGAWGPPAVGESVVGAGDARSRRAPNGPNGPTGTSGPAAPSTERATVILAAGTFASRLTGFLRVLTIGYVLGISSLSDAYNYANGIPNIIYDLLLGGILSATLIPVFVEQLRKEDRAESMRALSAITTAIVAALAVITAILWLLAPLVIHFYLLLNPAATGTAERALATRLLHYFAPQVFFLGAIVVSTALLNARRNFTAAAFSPVVNNLIAIGALLGAKAIASGVLSTGAANPVDALQRLNRDQHAILVLGLGTTAGYVVQLLVQLPAMRRVGFRLRPVWDLRHPAVRRVAQLSTWLIGVVIANQISLALVMILAGKVQGGVTAYQFSYQFFQLPYALIVVSIATALMPDLAERWSAGDRRGFEREFVAGLRVALAVIVPVGFVYVAIAQPFIHVAVDHGRVSPAGGHMVGVCLAIFAAGLPGFSAFFLLMRLYQAMQNTRTMFWIYLMENGLTVVAALLLNPILGVPGLVLAWVGPYTIGAAVAAYDLRRRVGSLGGTYTVRALGRILVASGVAVAAAYGVGRLFPGGADDVVLVARLVAQAGVGAAVYLAAARAIGIKELSPLTRMARRAVHPG